MVIASHLCYMRLSWWFCKCRCVVMYYVWSYNIIDGYMWLVYVIAWFAVVFGINSTSNAESNCTRRSRVQFTAL